MDFTNQSNFNVQYGVHTLNGSSFHKGNLDNVRIYTRAITEAEIQDLYECEKPADNPCANNGGDSDQDGICTDVDCNDNNPSIGAEQPEGTMCDDGNDMTDNDVILADGCTCQGEPEFLVRIYYPPKPSPLKPN